MVSEDEAADYTIYEPAMHFLVTLRKFSRDNKLAQVEHMLERVGIRLSETGMHDYVDRIVPCECYERPGFLSLCQGGTNDDPCGTQMCDIGAFDINELCEDDENKSIEANLMLRRIRYACTAPVCAEPIYDGVCDCLFESGDVDIAGDYPKLYCTQCATKIMLELMAEHKIQKFAEDGRVQMVNTCDCGEETDAESQIICRLCCRPCDVPTEEEMKKCSYFVHPEKHGELRSINGTAVTDGRYLGPYKEIMDALKVDPGEELLPLLQ